MGIGNVKFLGVGGPGGREVNRKILPRKTLGIWIPPVPKELAKQCASPWKSPPLIPMEDSQAPKELSLRRGVVHFQKVAYPTGQGPLPAEALNTALFDELLRFFAVPIHFIKAFPKLEELSG